MVQAVGAGVAKPVAKGVEAGEIGGETPSVNVAEGVRAGLAGAKACIAQGDTVRAVGDAAAERKGRRTSAARFPIAEHATSRASKREKFHFNKRAQRRRAGFGAAESRRCGRDDK